MTMDEILTVIRGSTKGGSTHGLSKLRTAAFCPRMAYLDELNRQQRIEEGDVFYDTLGEGALYIGSVFHALAAAYYQGTLKGLVVELSDFSTDEVSEGFLEGLRLFNAFIKDPEFAQFGKVVSVEEEYRAPMNFVGFELTIKPDLVTYMNQEDVDRFHRLHKGPDGEEVLLPGPGLYLHDHKTSEKKNSSDSTTMQEDPQFNLYPMVWNSWHPDQKARGMIANKIIRHKKLTPKSFYSVFVPTPTEDRKQSLQTALVNANELRKTNNTLGVIHGCRQYYRLCSYLGNQCSGV